MYLDKNTFKSVVKNTPLISIDLVIRNLNGEVLLGLRNNRPAKGFWFVPGGRILKDECLDVAFKRLIESELGLNSISSLLKPPNFLGVYQHFYNDNFSEQAFSTHYVVLAYQIKIDVEIATLPSEQHRSYQWFEVDKLLAAENVHQHTKWYFEESRSITSII